MNVFRKHIAELLFYDCNLQPYLRSKFGWNPLEPQTYRILNFVMGSFGLDSILWTEGVILDPSYLWVISLMIIRGFPINRVAGGPRQFFYATTILCTLGHFSNKVDQCICSRWTWKVETIWIVEKRVFGWNYSHYTPRACFAPFCSAPCCLLTRYITSYFTSFIFGWTPSGLSVSTYLSLFLMWTLFLIYTLFRNKTRT